MDAEHDNSVPRQSAYMMTVQGHILESLSASVFLLDEKGRILYLNESAQALIQASLHCVQGLPLTDFVIQGGDSAGNDGLLAACKKSLHENVRVWLHDVEIALPNVPQKKQVDCHITGIDIDADTRLIVEIMPHDAGHIRHGGMNHGNTRQTVIRGLAHEIRNPLGGMRGAAQLLAGELLSAAGTGASNRERLQGLTQYTDIIIREADRLSNLVEQMQASISVNKKQSLNIHSILEHVRQLAQSAGLDEETMPEKTITTDYDPSLPHVFGDSDQLIQAFINIVGNAEAAVVCRGRRGCIVLKSRIDCQTLPASGQQQQVVRVDVIDNGEGIEQALLAHVFEPMVSGKSTGTGLGLSITEEIIRGHDGLITVQSEPGHTVFSVWLKIAIKMNAKTVTR